VSLRSPRGRCKLTYLVKEQSVSTQIAQIQGPNWSTCSDIVV